ncbi:MAG: sulfur carrier protein ThiS [Oscillospiraceae bacterium]
MARINGEEVEISMTVSEYLEKESLKKERVAVMLNGEILPKDLYEATIIKPSDELEIVGFVGGG